MLYGFLFVGLVLFGFFFVEFFFFVGFFFWFLFLFFEIRFNRRSQGAWIKITWSYQENLFMY